MHILLATDGSETAGLAYAAAAIAREARRTLEPHVTSVITRIHEGPPGNVIVDMTTACRASLVALGSRGLGMVAGFLCW